MKFIWVDTETGGTDPKEDAMLQIACIFESGKNINKLHRTDEVFSEKVHPKGANVSKEALEVNRLKKKDIKKHPKKTFKKMLKWLDKRVDKLNKEDKLVVIGYNVKFDVEMIHGWAKREGYEYIGSYFDWRVIDVMVLARAAHALGHFDTPENFQLGTICEVFDIEHPTHDAMDDIVATRELFYKLTKGWKK